MVTAQQVLQGTLDRFKQTYWVRGSEFKLEKRGNKSPITFPSHKTSLNVNPAQEVAVYGACSIGLMAIAYAEANDSSQLQWFSNMWGKEESVTLAGYALCEAIRQTWFDGPVEKYAHYIQIRDAVTMITTWNDAHYANPRDRKHLRATYKRALESPILQSNEVWMLELKDMTRSVFDSIPFATKTQALDTLNELKDYRHSGIPVPKDNMALYSLAAAHDAFTVNNLRVIPSPVLTAIRLGT